MGAFPDGESALPPHPRHPLAALGWSEFIIAHRSYAEWNTGKVSAPIQELADAAGTTPTEAYRALSHLVELGALVRTGRGRYALNPDVAWSGSLVAREGAKVELSLV